MNIVYTQVRLQDIVFLEKKGFHTLVLTQPHQLYRGSAQGITITLFSSGKLLVQTTEPHVAHIRQLLSHLHEAPTSTPKKSTPVSTLQHYNEISVLGSDETLKGDTFGGLVVCGFLYEPSLQQQLLDLGVQDSKNLNSERICTIASQLLVLFPERIFMEELFPEQYNQIQSTTPTTAMMNALHKKVAASKPRNALHVVDKYPGCLVGDVRVEKAETHSLAVAAASILASHRGILQFEELSHKIGFQLPKGSTHVGEALRKLKREGLPFEQYTKLHFSNVRKIIENQVYSP